jgi:hypothetical protein
MLEPATGHQVAEMVDDVHAGEVTVVGDDGFHLAAPLFSGLQFGIELLPCIPSVMHCVSQCQDICKTLKTLEQVGIDVANRLTT